MKARAQRGGDRIGITLARWRDAGLAVSVSPLPYNAETDFVDEAARAKERLALQRSQMGLPPQGAGDAKERAPGGANQQRQQQQAPQQLETAQMLRVAQVAPTNTQGSAAPASAGRKLLRGA